ncbi:MAG TPA: hypothetical protein PLR51_04040, partial [Methanomassiliicoccales archaeon]|jgi:hypothetical protein|nr:hypothetical protein [Methanomassiliicoccales archaeon]HQQ25434.1 hypothetical protein [Methanomassiliicoccales archaeon]
MAEQAYPKRTVAIFSLLLLVAAVLFYWVWGVSYGSWNIFAAENMGVYSIFIILLGLGVFGLLLAKYKQ